MEVVSVAWLLDKAWVLLFFILSFYVKGIKEKDVKRDKELEELKLFRATAEIEYIKSEKMHKDIAKALGPYKEDQQELKALITGLNQNITSLSKDVAVQYAIGNLSHDNG